MRILILDTYYSRFVSDLYRSRPELATLPYFDQWSSLMAECFGTADFYSSALGELGHEAHEVISNAYRLQLAWSQEYAPLLARAARVGLLPKVRHRWESAVIRAQVEWYKPDVLLVQNIDHFPRSLVRWAKEKVRVLVAQHATALGDLGVVAEYDLVISAVPRLVERLRDGGANAEYLKLAFGEQVLSRLGDTDVTYDVVHVGSYGPLHDERNDLLEVLATRFDCHYWGTNIERLDSDSPIRGAYRGEAWGIDMYRRRAASKTTVTKHIRAVVGPDVANCTMFETTGIGACLVVDRGRNLSEIFDPDDEVVAYDSHADAVEKISYLLSHESERLRIARAGQQRTLKEHTYLHRMHELDGFIQKVLAAP